MTHDNLSFENRLIAFLPNLRRFAISLCRSREIADDLVQTACERALRSSDHFEPGTRFDAWMFRILRNLWIDEIRRRKTAGPSEDISDRTDISVPSGEAASHARMELDGVAQAIDRLPDEQREVLVLVCVDELSYRQAAEVLSIPIGTVMSRLARARKNLSDMTGISKGAERSSGMKGSNS
ncbi:RNA polymerase sigma factor [Pararhizobium sp. BT-229]|uniref:RNA polymerase sigma factor n=1 Tax=Pararhizobium sp. BT-229 TaxID=2986923 RepID=UPI0021F7302F|nr:RNA polymerase sigma factor [Pararhizobium sp. BT-229]MCV9967167.1 RNA polymerase sigma factor [Pararhizobium sp. BT-229]